MTRLTFILPDGREKPFDATDGLSLLEVARQHDLAIEGACGGAMACATCHVIVDPTSFARLPRPEPEEEDMLDFAEGLSPTSRLGCQLHLSADLDGMTVRIPVTSWVG